MESAARQWPASLAMLLCMLAGVSPGTADQWAASVSASWSTNAAWSDNSAPTAADSVVIDATGSPYTVTLDVSASILSLSILSDDATLYGGGGGKTMTTGGGASVTHGTLEFAGITWTAQAGVTNNATMSLAGGSVSGAGEIVNWATMNLTSSALLFLPLRNESIGTIDLQNMGVKLHQEDFTNHGTVTMGHVFSVEIGHHNETTSTGRFVNQAAGTLQILGSNAKIRIPIDNHGEFDLQHPLAVQRAGVSHTNSGTITGSDFKIESGARAIDNSGTIDNTNPTFGLGFYGDNDPASSFTNSGLIRSGHAIFINSFRTLENSGTIDFGGGTLEVVNSSSGFQFINRPAGTISGDGSIVTITNTTLSNEGTISPGALPEDSIGTIGISGAVAGTEGSSLRIEIGAGPAADQLNVGRNFTLDGRLDVGLLDGLPASGTSLTILTANTINGQASFDNVSGGRVSFPGGSAAVTVGAGSISLDDFQPPGFAFESWQASEFTPGELANPAISGPDADPDLDGCDNLWEFATMTGPKDPASFRLPAASRGADRLRITYVRRSGGTGTTGVDYSVDGISYSVEQSPNLEPGSWISGPGTVQQVGDASDNGDGTESITIELSQLIGDAPRRFGRIRIEADF